ncbi:MAG: DNA methyltransferase [Candidatus Methanofastidiosia archaeon]
MNHITSALPPKTHTPMYLMHKYWARKPHNIVNKYIKNYTKKGDIVLDPFCGSGVTALESLKLGRKAIAVDVDPMATFITRMTAIPINLKEFEKTFTSIKENVEHKILSLYKTTCRKCKTQVFATHVIWETKNDSEIPTTVWYTCPECKNNVYQKEKIKNDDIKTLQKIKKMDIPNWYPDNDLIWNTRVNVHKGTKVSDLFTKRALIGLSILLNEIEKITNDSLKSLMKFVFSGTLPQASKLVFVIQRRGRHSGKGKKTQEVGSWATRGYWVPPKHFEINVWNCFKNRFKKVLRGKKESNSLIKVYNEANKFEYLDNKNIFIKTANILNLTDFIPENSIDYIFTDPPYGDSIPYLELDYMWSSWLQFDPYFEDEIVISDSPERNKHIEQYETMLHKAFIQVFTVLKPGKFMTVTFHNTDIKMWNCIIRAAVLSGFSLEKIIYQPPARPSPKGLLHPYGSAVGDYYIRFFKPKIKPFIAEPELNKTKYEKIVVEIAKKLIAERGEPIPYQYILNGVIPELNNHGALLKGDKDIKEIMKDHLNDEFVLIDVKNDKGELIGHKWWLKDLSCISFLGKASG